jgi:hypothetical protein
MDLSFGLSEKRLPSAPTALAAGALAMAMPGAACADYGMGFVDKALQTFVYALVPMIVLEAVVLAIMLSLPAFRALRVSLNANVASTIVAVIGILAIEMLVRGAKLPGPGPTKIAASMIMLPLFCMAWRLEHSTVVRLAPDKPRHRVFRATGWANLISYCAIFAVAWAYAPSSGTYGLTSRVTEAAMSAESTKDAVSRFWEQHGRLPVSAQELPEGIPTFTRDTITLEPSGQVSVRLSAADMWELDGTHFIVTPIAHGSKYPLDWQCSSPDITLKYLPMTCRRPAGERAGAP